MKYLNLLLVIALLVTLSSCENSSEIDKDFEVANQISISNLDINTNYNSLTNLVRFGDRVVVAGVDDERRVVIIGLDEDGENPSCYLPNFGSTFPEVDRLKSIEIDNNMDYLLSGIFSDGTYFVARLSSSFTLYWYKQFSLPISDLKQFHANYLSRGEVVISYRDGDHISITKLSNDGSLVWDNEYKCEFYEESYPVSKFHDMVVGKYDLIVTTYYSEPFNSFIIMGVDLNGNICCKGKDHLEIDDRLFLTTNIHSIYNSYYCYGNGINIEGNRELLRFDYRANYAPTSVVYEGYENLSGSVGVHSLPEGGYILICQNDLIKFNPHSSLEWHYSDYDDLDEIKDVMGIDQDRYLILFRSKSTGEAVVRVLDKL